MMPFDTIMVLQGDHRMQLGVWLEASGCSNAEFGKRIGRSAEAVRRYAGGERIPDRETMPRIVDATNGKVTANDFFGIAQAAAKCGA
jgi:transcriptional regulator with XRE-family HTH domain